MPAGEVVLTQVVLSNSGRMLFAGTSGGTVRAIKFPLTDPGEWQEHQAHSTAVTRVVDQPQWCVSGYHTECRMGTGFNFTFLLLTQLIDISLGTVQSVN